MLYRPRVVDSELTAALGAVGAVLIEGPKACGKTETARQAAHSEVRLDVDTEARLAAATDPALVLDGETPRLTRTTKVTRHTGSPMTASESGTCSRSVTRTMPTP